MRFSPSNPFLRHSWLIMTLALPLLLSACQSTKQANTSFDIPTVNPSTQQTQTSTLEHYYLDNGLQVILKPNHRTPIVMTQIWYQAGSNDESLGKGGVAHFLEHMMFKDNKLLNSQDYHRLISQLGGQKNAFTSQNYTVYYKQLPANQYPVALQIEASRMQDLIIRADEVATENKVIQEERRQRIDSNPLSQAFEEFNKIIQPNSPKGRPVIGDMTDIQNLTVNDITAWYHTYYRPNNATLVLVGDFDKNQAKRFIEQYFGHIKANAQPITRHDLTMPSHQGPKHHQAEADVNVPNLIMGFNVPSITTNPQHALALMLLQDIADGGLSARFERKLIRDQKLLDGISVSYHYLDKGDTVFMIHAVPKQNISLSEAQIEILQTLSEISADTISDDEIKRSQNNLVASMVFANDSIKNQAQLYGMLASLNLPLNTIDNLPNQLSKVSKADIEYVNRHYLVKDNLTTMYVLPKNTKNNVSQ